MNQVQLRLQSDQYLLKLICFLLKFRQLMDQDVHCDCVHLVHFFQQLLVNLHLKLRSND